MHGLLRPWGVMHARADGPPDAPTLLMANSLGTDLRMWDHVVALLPGFRILRFDKRGHGLSATPDSGWTIEDLADDAAAVLDHFGAEQATVAGCSIGGMIAQALALRHPARVTGLVLSNTAAKVGTAESWQARIEALKAGGMAAIADQVLARWFTPDFLRRPEAQLWRQMLLSCDAQGYAGTCGALAAGDLTGQVHAIRVPSAFITGSEDKAVPPDDVRATADRITGSEFHVLTGSGHIPAIDAPAQVATIISDIAARGQA